MWSSAPSVGRAALCDLTDLLTAREVRILRQLDRRQRLLDEVADEDGPRGRTPTRQGHGFDRLARRPGDERRERSKAVPSLATSHGRARRGFQRGGGGEALALPAPQLARRHVFAAADDGLLRQEIEVVGGRCVEPLERRTEAAQSPKLGGVPLRHAGRGSNCKLAICQLFE